MRFNEPALPATLPDVWTSGETMELATWKNSEWKCILYGIGEFENGEWKKSEWKFIPYGGITHRAAPP